MAEGAAAKMPGRTVTGAKLLLMHTFGVSGPFRDNVAFVGKTTVAYPVGRQVVFHDINTGEMAFRPGWNIESLVRQNESYAAAEHYDNALNKVRAPARRHCPPLHQPSSQGEPARASLAPILPHASSPTLHTN